MEIKISDKNTKLGPIPNLSLTPGLSCVPNVPCLDEGCYAKNAYERWPNVKSAWDHNLEMYLKDPRMFFYQFRAWLNLKHPDRFRLFVGGDFPDMEFYENFASIAEDYEDVKFLTFTKRYDYDFSNAPPNLNIVLSTWPGHPLPTNTDLPWAWLEEDVRRPKENYFLCGGLCQSCKHFCWDKVTADCPVVFKKH